MVEKFEVGRKYQCNGQSCEYEILFVGPEGNAVAKYDYNGKTLGGTLPFSGIRHYTEVVKKRTFWFGCSDITSTYFECTGDEFTDNGLKGNEHYKYFRWIKVEL